MATTLDFYERLDNLLVFRQGEQRAPHKPLYLLYCIAGVQKGRARLQAFDAVSPVLTSALQMFGPWTKSLHPQYPFWRLQNDGLAEVLHDGPLSIRKSNNDPTVTSLRQQNARGGLLQPDYEMLLGNLALQSLAMHKILDAHFPRSIHDEIIRFFGLTLDEPHAKDKISDVEFHDGVLSAYGNRCALTGFNLEVAGRSMGIEAAHIFWPQSGGNDQVSNGIAMTVLHRKLFHLGLFTIRPDYKIVISSKAVDRGDSQLSLSSMSGIGLSLPQDKTLWPNPTALLWHQRWVFRG
jgi:putative restriction endonuclease